MLNYKASGELLDHGRNGNGRVVILVNNGGVQPFVVSTYREGAEEWDSGRYFTYESDAIDHFQKLTNRSTTHLIA